MQCRDVDFRVRDLTKHTHHSAWHTMHNVICGGARLQDANLEAVVAAGIPVQVVHGADDQVVPVECSRHLMAKLPRAKLSVMDRRDHSTVVNSGQGEGLRRGAQGVLVVSCFKVPGSRPGCGRSATILMCLFVTTNVA